MTSVLRSASILLALFATTFGTGIQIHPKICSTDNCTNDHVKDNVEGPVFRYSKNAANFRELKVSGGATKEESANQSEIRLGHASEVHQPRAADNHVSGSSRQGIDNSEINNSVHAEHDKIDGSVFRADAKENQKQKELEENRDDDRQSPPDLQSNSNPAGQRTDANATRASSVGSWKDVSKDPMISRAVEDGIFWSTTVERAIPPGLTDEEVENWKRRIRQVRVAKVEDATLEKCGSNKNRHVVFEDGRTSCARYRHPMVHLVFGELYCYHLSRMLGMRNIPPIVLSRVSNASSSQWSSVLGDVHNAGWENDTLASFSLWIDHLGKAYMPEMLVEHQRSTVYPWTHGFRELNVSQLVELAQFSDLMIFDYITGHLDRMTIRKNAVDYYQMDWLYKGEVHNLAKHRNNGGLWFIDNENGIFNAYNVLYGYKNYETMQQYHTELLQSMCMFRRSTVEAVNALADLENPYQALNQTVFENEHVVEGEAKLRQWQTPKLAGRFKERVTAVAKWIAECKSRSSG